MLDVGPALSALVGAWLPTFVAHSTLLVGLAAIVTQLRPFRSWAVRDLVWTAALWGGLVTAALHVALFADRVTMPLPDPPALLLWVPLALLVWLAVGAVLSLRAVVLPPSVRADIVLMNPPFSQTAGRLGRRRVPTVGTDHVLQALRRLDAGGRLVTVLSEGVRRGKPTHRAFFEAVDTAPYRLRADVEVGGAVYRPYGTSVRTRLLVVDRTPQRETGGARGCVEAVIESVSDAVDALSPIFAG